MKYGNTWATIPIRNTQKYGHSAGTGEHPTILGVRVHYTIPHVTHIAYFFVKKVF